MNRESALKATWVIVLGLAGMLVSSSLASCAWPWESPLKSCVQPSDHARELTFQAAGGEQVHGAVLGKGDVGVVLAHRQTANACSWLPYARLLDKGRRVLLFDFGSDATGDVVGAVRELRRQGAAKIVVIGASRGGTASLVAARSITPPVAGVATLSAPANYDGMDALTAVKTLTIPVLFMAARDDNNYGVVLPADARARFAACPSEHKQLAILPGSEHGDEMLNGGSGQQAKATLEKFIETAAGTAMTP